MVSPLIGRMIFFGGWLFSEDGDLKEAHGFVVSLKLGRAVTGFHGHDGSQKAIHVFRFSNKIGPVLLVVKI